MPPGVELRRSAIREHLQPRRRLRHSGVQSRHGAPFRSVLPASAASSSVLCVGGGSANAGSDGIFGVVDLRRTRSLGWPIASPAWPTHNASPWPIRRRSSPSRSAGLVRLPLLVAWDQRDGFDGEDQPPVRLRCRGRPTWRSGSTSAAVSCRSRCRIRRCSSSASATRRRHERSRRPVSRGGFRVACFAWPLVHPGVSCCRCGAQFSDGQAEDCSAGQWQQQRDGLLTGEKEATRTLDALAARRRRLPMVKFGFDTSGWAGRSRGRRSRRRGGGPLRRCRGGRWRDRG